jgi:hypothetical protein
MHMLGLSLQLCFIPSVRLSARLHTGDGGSQAAGYQPWEGCRHRDNAEMVEILSSTLMGIVSNIQSSHCCQQLGCCHRAQPPSKTTTGNKDQ